MKYINISITSLLASIFNYSSAHPPHHRYDPPLPRNTEPPYVVYSNTGKNITDIILNNEDQNCSAYIGNYYAVAKDEYNDITRKAYLTIIAKNGDCIFTSNAIPNHTYNNSAKSFPNNVTPQYQQYMITQAPKKTGYNTSLTLESDNAIFLNGVKIDLLAAGCFGVGNGRIGCHNINTPWRYDPAYKGSGFNIDTHNGHSQPDGTYHYHATPNALYSYNNTSPSPVIGFAADGFPIYGSYVDKDGKIVEVKSSYQLKTGARPSGTGNPGGTYNGMYRDDYEYIRDSGDLDECNGMTHNGQYGYYVSSGFPYIINCYKGTPNSSFKKKIPGHHEHNHL